MQPREEPASITTNPISYENFLSSYRGQGTTTNLPLARLAELINHSQYGEVESLLLIHLDNLDNIQSSVEIDPSKKKYPTGVAYVRDASLAKPLAERLSPEDPLVLRDNLLLRALSTVRGINQALLYHATPDSAETFNEARKKLQESYSELIYTLASEANPGAAIFKKIQANFSTKLAEVLHDTNLDAGIENHEQLAKLLAAYRDMASTIDPAKTLVTLRKESRQNVEKTTTETSYPVTQKTEKQIQQLAVLNSEMKAEKDSPINYHSVKPQAFKLLDHAFADLIKDNDRRLPAQSRYSTGPTVKNGYIVHNQIKIKQNDKEEIANHWSSRTGSMAYVGAGESEENIIDFTKENLQQLINASKLLAPERDKFHFTMLLTDFAVDSQDQIIRHTKAAIQLLANEKIDFEFSNIPVNAGGTIFELKLSGILEELGKELKLPIPHTSRDIGDSASRYMKAAQTIDLISNSTDRINNTACASGQDRTGTAQEIALIIWETKVNLDNLVKNQRIDSRFPDLKSVTDALQEQIKMKRALAGNNAFLASFATPGSTGMKLVSQPDNYFPEKINEFHYRKTSKTNKAPPINKKELDKKYFYKVEKRADLETLHIAAQEQINSTSDPKKILSALAGWAEGALKYQSHKDNAESSLLGSAAKPVAKIFRFGFFGNGAEAAGNLRTAATTIAAKINDAKTLSSDEKIRDFTTQIDSLLKAINASSDNKSNLVLKEANSLIAAAANKLNPRSPSPE